MKFLFKQSYDDDIKLFKHSGYVRATILFFLLAALLPVFFLATGAKFTALTHPIQILTFAICALGLMVLTGYTGQVSLGHGAFFALGAYFFHFLLFLGQNEEVTRLVFPQFWEPAMVALAQNGGWIPWYFALVTTPLVLGLFGYLVARPTLRMSGVTLAITTLLFMIFIEQAFKQWTFMGGGDGFRVPKLVENGNWLFEGIENIARSVGDYDPESRRAVVLLERTVSKYSLYYGSLFALTFVIWLLNNLVRSRLGRTLIAIRDSEVSAQSMGVNVNHYKSLAMGISAAIAGLAGIFLSYNGDRIAPESINFITSIILLLIIVVGGLGSIHGAIFGAITYVFLREILFPELAELFHHWADQGGSVFAGGLAWLFNIGGLGDIFFAVLLLIILFSEPLGLYARWKKSEAFFQTFPFYRAGTFRQQRAYAKTQRLR